jgi:hypothetical protein
VVQPSGQGVLFYLGTTNGVSTPIYMYFQSGPIQLVGSAFGATSSPATVTLNTWHHFALVVHGTAITTYVDGVAGTLGSTVSRGSIGGANWLLTIGDQQPSGVTPFQGFIDEFRITKGIALYTANFTPPTTPFTTDSIVIYGQDFRLGTWQSLATPYGKRRGESSMGDPIDTSGP